MRINPEQLITFSVVAEYGSVSRAASALNLSQPTISGQLRALQEQVGQPLYERRSRGVILTAAGEQLLPYANAVARNVRLASEQISDLQRRPERPVRVGLSYALSGWAVRLALRAQESEQRLTLTAGLSERLVELVEQDELDAALVVTPLVPPRELEVTRLGEEELRLIVPAGHRLMDQGFTPLSVLQGERMLWVSRGSGVQTQTQRLLERAGVLPRAHLELGSLSAVRLGLLQGAGVALLPPSYVEYEVRAGLLGSLGIEDSQTMVSHLLVTPPRKLLGPEARAFVASLTGTDTEAAAPLAPVGASR